MSQHTDIARKEWLTGKTLTGLQRVCREFGLPRYAANQVAGWLYGKRARSLDQMSDLSKAAREKLAAGFEPGHLEPADVQISADGTKKYLFPTLSGGFVEAVYIPDGDRATLCISSQAGCRMGCRFCMTARQGFQHNLTAGEIVNQIFSIPEFDFLTNVVFMGMGEPLDNLPAVLDAIEILTAPWGLGWSPSRITVSTIGVMAAVRELLEKTRVSLAVSLHNPFDQQRAELMPVQKMYPAGALIEELKKHDFTRHRRLSFEYIVFEGWNDSEKHVLELARLLKGLECRVNLIRFHRIPDSPLKGASDDVIYRINGALNKAGVTTTTRRSRGEDILAACGMLSTKAKEEKS